MYVCSNISKTTTITIAVTYNKLLNNTSDSLCLMFLEREGGWSGLQWVPHIEWLVGNSFYQSNETQSERSC